MLADMAPVLRDPIAIGDQLRVQPQRMGRQNRSRRDAQGLQFRRRDGRGQRPGPSGERRLDRIGPSRAFGQIPVRR